jgi:hypothetical protein
MQSPVDAIESLLESLDPKEKQKLIDRIVMTEKTPCQKIGHKWKTCGIQTSWLGLMPKTKLFCEKCGKMKLV